MMKDETPVLIGIAGGSASGKTLISKRIYQKFSDRHSIVTL